MWLFACAVFCLTLLGVAEVSWVYVWICAVWFSRVFRSRRNLHDAGQMG